MKHLRAAFTPFWGVAPAGSSMAQLMPTNFVTDWVTDWAESLATSLSNARIDIVKGIVKTSLPSLSELRTDWFMLSLGGTYGLASLLVTFVAVAVGFFMILSPLKDHSLRINRTVTSLIYASIFGLVFFRLYSLAYDMTQGVSHALINLALGKETSSINEATELLVRSILPSDPWMKLFVAGVGFLLTYAAYIVAYINYVMIIVIAIFYIFPLVLRPLGEKFNSAFHVFNSGIATTLATPLILVFGLMLPFAVEKYIPFGSTGFGAGLSTIVGACIAFFGPLLFATWVFRKSHEVFGAIDSNVSGRIDIGSMPSVNASQMNDSVKESAFKAFGSTAAAGLMTANLNKSDDVLGDIKKVAIEAGGTAAMAAGHPWVAAALSTVDTTLSKEKRAHQQDSLAAMPPPAPGSEPYVPEEQTAPETPPPPSSPIVEYPDRKNR